MLKEQEKPKQQSVDVKLSSEEVVTPPVSLEVEKPTIRSMPVTQEPVRPDTSKPPKLSVERATNTGLQRGSVLLVNRKFNFIVVDLGSKQGLNIDDLVAVQDEGVQIAKARIEKIYDDYSAAYIIEELSDFEIKEGALVRPM